MKFFGKPGFQKNQKSRINLMSEATLGTERRRLAAIDVAGYSRLMEVDEDSKIADLKLLRDATVHIQMSVVKQKWKTGIAEC